jgi:hypothetical protein
MFLRHRFQEWAADRFAWVQYPDVRPMHKRPRLMFKTQMPWEKRFALVLFGFAALAACAVALFFLCLLLWAAVTA